MIRFKDYFILNELKETKTIVALLMKKLGVSEEEVKDYIIPYWKEIEPHINSEVVDELFDDQIPCSTLSDEELYKIAREENPRIDTMNTAEREWALHQARIYHHRPVSDIKNPKDIFAWISKCRSPEHAKRAVWGVIDTVLQEVIDKYAQGQVNYSSEVFRAQLAEEIHRTLRLNDVIDTRSADRTDYNLFESRYR